MHPSAGGEGTSLSPRGPRPAPPPSRPPLPPHRRPGHSLRPGPAKPGWLPRAPPAPCPPVGQQAPPAPVSTHLCLSQGPPAPDSLWGPSVDLCRLIKGLRALCGLRTHPGSAPGAPALERLPSGAPSGLRPPKVTPWPPAAALAPATFVAASPTRGVSPSLGRLRRSHLLPRVQNRARLPGTACAGKSVQGSRARARARGRDADTCADTQQLSPRSSAGPVEGQDGFCSARWRGVQREPVSSREEARR